MTHPARAYGGRLLFSSCATVLSQPHFLRDVLRQRAVTQTAQLPEANEECGEGDAHGVGHLFDQELVRRPQNVVPIYGDAVCASVHGNYIANHEAGHQKGCAHAINLRFPEAEQVFEVLLRVGALPIKFTVKGGAGNCPVHDVVSALVADGKAPSAAFVLPPQTALDHDGTSWVNAIFDFSVLIHTKRGHAVRNEADLVAVLLGKAAVQQGQLQKVRNEPLDVHAAGALRFLPKILADQALAQFVEFLIGKNPHVSQTPPMGSGQHTSADPPDTNILPHDRS